MEELAGVIAEGQEDVCLIFEEEEGLEDKIHDTLRRHVSFWKESGASNFAISVVENGYVPQMWENPQEYEEKNNGSYREERIWANEAVGKLVRARLVREVDRRSLVCVNPLTVASNAKGKRRLCIDLSRCVNKVIKAPKFKIESTIAALQVIEKDDYCFSFDLKSAYLQVKLNENFLQYFGFAIDFEDGSRKYFQYLSMPFGLNDACRVLTKLLRSPLDRWRRNGIRVFIHVDDGFGIVKGRQNAVRASNEVRRDLTRYGWLTSEEKNEWGARRNVIWTGFVWDTVNFKLWVTEEKLCRTELLLKELWNKRSEIV